MISCDTPSPLENKSKYPLSFFPYTMPSSLLSIFKENYNSIALTQRSTTQRVCKNQKMRTNNNLDMKLVIDWTHQNHFKNQPPSKDDNPWFFLVGLSKERPILDHHAKAHIHEIRWISHEIWWISPEIRQISGEIHPKPYKIRCFNKNSSVWGVHGGGYDPRFHEIQGHSPSPAFIKLNSFDWNICFYKVLGGFHVKSKDHLQGIVTLCL